LRTVLFRNATTHLAFLAAAGHRKGKKVGFQKFKKPQSRIGNTFTPDRANANVAQ
jgi:hypothetical protein